MEYTVPDLRVCLNVLLREIDNYGLFLFFIFIAYKHFDFTLGGDPALPIRVLVSVPSTIATPEFSESSEKMRLRWMLSNAIESIFFELVFGPAILKLSSKEG